MSLCMRPHRSGGWGHRTFAGGFPHHRQLAGVLFPRAGPLGRRQLPDVGELQARLVDRQL